MALKDQGLSTHYASFPGAKAPSKTPSVPVTANTPPPPAVAMEEQPATTTPAAPAQQDGAAALLIDTTMKEDWSEEMEVATQPEEYVERRVKIREDVPPIPTTRKVLIPDTPNVSVKDRLGVRGGQRYPPGPRQGQDYQNRHQQSQGQYGPGGAPAKARLHPLPLPGGKKEEQLILYLF